MNSLLVVKAEGKCHFSFMVIDVEEIGGSNEFASVTELLFKPESLLKLAVMRMPFGKYQGRVLIDLPEPYVVWFLKKGLPPGELGELLALLYEVKLNGLEALFDPLRHRDSSL